MPYGKAPKNAGPLGTSAPTVAWGRSPHTSKKGGWEVFHQIYRSMTTMVLPFRD